MLKKGLRIPFRKWVIIIIGFGILIRLVQYLYNRSLWADEAKIALNIVNSSYLDFLQPLDYDQAAPVGFLMVEKLAVQLFGNNEYALRLFPLLVSIFSLFIFYRLARFYLNKRGTLFALALFSSNQYLVYYASETKQYASDVAIGLVMFWVLLHSHTQALTPARTIWTGLVGAIAIWFSHPVVFILAGVELVYLISDLQRYLKRSLTTRQESQIAPDQISPDQIAPDQIGQRLGIYGIWLSSFIAFYLISLADIRSNKFLPFTWSNEFPESPWDGGWFFDATRLFFYKPLGFPPVISELAGLMFLIGCISLFKHQRVHLFSLITPALLTLLAGYLHQYPFDNRLVLFLAPFFIILLVKGLTNILESVRVKSALASGLIAIFILGFPVVEGCLFLVKPYMLENIKPVMDYVRDHHQPGDEIYVFQKGKFQFRYYAARYGFTPDEYKIGIDLDDDLTQTISTQDEKVGYRNDINQFKGEPRVWFLVSDSRLRDETEFVISHLDKIGQKVDSFKSNVPTSFVSLYDL
ncbi:MAG: glycosyltransferase family 39 protein [Elainellaceae cyanobacterium]